MKIIKIENIKESQTEIVNNNASVKDQIENAFIQGVKSGLNHQWIKASESLPQLIDGETYSKNILLGIVDDGEHTGVGYYSKDGNFYANSPIPLVGVTHWMPIPHINLLQ